MIIDRPAKEQIPQLRRLWKEAFGDEDAFLDIFWKTAFRQDRCRCITDESAVAAALYWFDCMCRGKKIAYIYAVATGKAYQGRGLCRRLMANTHDVLKQTGYAGAILVPGSESLFDMYRKMGYETCSWVTEFACDPQPQHLQLQQVDLHTYGQLRRKLLPEGAVVQEGRNLDFLASYTQLWAGDDVLFAATTEENVLRVTELLGDFGKAPGITAALGCNRGSFRTPGNGHPFAMYYALDQNPPPSYFGWAFD